MKKILIGMMLIAGVLSMSAETAAQKLAATAAKISLADARSRIDKAIENPKVMNAIVKHLSAEDQVKFLAEVNKAISEMPASNEERAAKALDANRAALTAGAGNVAALTAEMFATAPIEALPILSESVAGDLFNRATDPKVTYTDKQFLEISTNLMAKVNERCAQIDNGAPRSALAIAMLVRASNGTPEDLANVLIDTMPSEEARNLARTEWVPSALGTDGHAQSYESILTSAEAGEKPKDNMVFILVSGVQFHDALLADLTGNNTEPDVKISDRTPILDAIIDVIEPVPALGNDILGAAGQSGAGYPQDVQPPVERPVEPSPYAWQRP